jgi:hypothetical protein
VHDLTLIPRASCKTIAGDNQTTISCERLAPNMSTSISPVDKASATLVDKAIVSVPRANIIIIYIKALARAVTNSCPHILTY